MMRDKLKFILVIVILITIVTSCVDNKTYQNEDSSDNIRNHSNKVNQDKTAEKDTNTWDMDKLRQSLGIKDEMEILFQHYNDFDSDNSEELIIAFGHEYTDGKDYIEDIYYIEEGEDVYEILSHIKSSGYGIYSVELINLIDMDLPVLYCKNTNYANLIGFELYEVKDDSLKQLVYSASATGVGHDEMLDDDGVYSGFVQNRSSYDTLYTNLKRYYKFKNGKFEIEDVSVDFYNYPDTPEKVVLEYLNMHNLRQLEEIEIPDIESRLEEICPRVFNPPILYDYDVMVEYNMMLEGALEFNTKVYEQTNITEVYVKYNGDKDKSEVVYSLGKSDDKWLIYDYRVISGNNGEHRRITEYFDSIYVKDGNDIIRNRYKNILLSQTPFSFFYVVSDGEKSYYLNNITYDGYWMKPLRFSLVDMNDDLIPELVVESSLGTAGFVLVIREFENEMIAHEFSHRQMYDLKKDGTFGASGGAAYSGYFKLEFDNSSYYINRIAETDTEEDLDGNLIPIFYIGETLTDEDEFWEFWESLRNKEEAEWIYFELNDDIEN